MKRSLPSVLVLALALPAIASPASAQAPARRATNPVLWADVPDPSVLRVGGVY
jgi:hypothetical protein